MRLLGNNNVKAILRNVTTWMSFYNWFSKISNNFDCMICFDEDGEWNKPFHWSYLKQGDQHGIVKDVYHLKLDANVSMCAPFDELETVCNVTVSGEYDLSITSNPNHIGMTLRYYRNGEIWTDCICEVTFSSYVQQPWGWPMVTYHQDIRWINYLNHTTGERAYDGGYNLQRSQWIDLVSIDTNPFVSVYGLQNYISTHYDWSDNSLRDLYEDCVSGIQMNTNNLQNAKEIFDIVGIISKPVTGLLELCENVGQLVSDGSKGAINAAGKAWMAYRYQYSTTLSDLYEALRFLEDNGKIMDYKVRESDLRTKIEYLTNTEDMCRTLRSSCSVHQGVAHYSMRLSRPLFNSISASANALMDKLWDFKVNVERYGLSINTYNVWDMLPLSFVVDWIVPIGDATESLQKDWVKDYFHISDICYSEKRTFDIIVGGIPCKGTLYTRNGYDHVPVSSVYKMISYTGGKTDCYALDAQLASEFLTSNYTSGSKLSTLSKRFIDAVVMLNH